jgi:hypothetical protein
MVISMAQAKGGAVKVITIHQPWASLIMAGAKPFEFRSWRPPASMIGGRIGIHASAQKVDVGFIARLCAGLRGGRLNSTVGGVCELCLHIEKALPVLSRACSPDSDPLPTGVILGTAHLGAPVPAWEAAGIFAASGENGGDAGLWAWPLDDIFPWSAPAPARGTRRIWTWNRTLWPRRVLSAARTHAPA